jgi:hypothetical protein
MEAGYQAQAIEDGDCCERREVEIPRARTEKAEWADGKEGRHTATTVRIDEFSVTVDTWARCIVLIYFGDVYTSCRMTHTARISNARNTYSNASMGNECHARSTLVNEALHQSATAGFATSQ